MANVLDKYRQTHKRLRNKLNPYTAKLCPECSEPCCRKPVRVKEFDILIANACGCSFKSTDDAINELIENGFNALKDDANTQTELIPCEYLDDSGCMFPDDLRPYECARYICGFLKNEIKPSDMREIKDLLHKLSVAHRELKEVVIPSNKSKTRS